jgi:predicted Zn-dependent protease
MAQRVFHAGGRLALAFCLALLPCLAKDKSKDNKKDPDAIGHRDVGKGLNFYSFEREIALGKRMAWDVERNGKVIDDPMVAEYINRLGQKVVRNSDAKVPFTIKVLDTGEVNAFALPGGFLFVDSGLILETDNEAELAAVMAHEIAHVTARHGTRMATRGELLQYATLPLIFAGGWAAYGVYHGVGVAAPIGLLKFSRGFEAEADMLGLQYMYKAGYDPTALVDFFEDLETLERKRPGLLSKLLTTHPMTEDRIKATREHIQNLAPRPEYVLNTSEFMEVKARLAMLENERNPDAGENGRPTLQRASGAGGTVDCDSDGNGN